MLKSSLYSLFCNVSYRILSSFSFACYVNGHDRLCGLAVRVLGYRSGGLGSIPGTTKKKSSGSGTGSTQSREYN
jgi:hypothetical protein